MLRLKPFDPRRSFVGLGIIAACFVLALGGLWLGSRWKGERQSATDELLEAAAAPGDAAVREYLRRGADPNTRDERTGFTPLMVAATAGNLPAALALLHAGADVHARGRDGATPLLMALPSGNQALATALIAAGADVNARRADGTTPLTWAARWGKTELVKTLLERGADPRIRGAEGKTAREWAAQAHHPDGVRLLAEAEQRRR